MAAMQPLAITVGDPAGIGPEIVAKALRDMSASERAEIVVIGNIVTMQRAAALVGADLVFATGFGPHPDRGVATIDIAAGAVADGRISPAGRQAAVRAVERAVALASGGRISVIVTAPLNKAALHAAGHEYDGHTGLLAALTRSPSGYMLLASEKLSAIHVSTHVSLAEATRRPTLARVLGAIEAGDRHLRRLGMAAPRIAVAGLNPHCGEGGIFGTEEIDTIGPAIAAAKARGFAVTGPLPGDTVFHRALKGEFDLVVAQYHDQGHIPVKLIAFDTTVNVTLGLPIERTSVDHGTAFDIAWKGDADHTNIKAAIAYARRIAARPAK